MAADTCVAVVKYSYATGVRADNSIPWTHVIASDVYLLLKGEDTHIQNGRLSMQVIQRNSILETIPASDLIDQAIEARHGSQQVGIKPHIEQLPIFCIQKDNLLAFRFRLSDGQARRVQFRLSSLEESTHIAGILERRGMEFQQQHQRPRTARPLTARSDTSGASSRPVTTQTLTTASHDPNVPIAAAKDSPFQLQALEAGGLSSQRVGSTSSAPLDRMQSRRPSFNHSTHNFPMQMPRRATTVQSLGCDSDHDFPVPDLPKSHARPSQYFAGTTVSHGQEASALPRAASTSASGNPGLVYSSSFERTPAHQASQLSDQSDSTEQHAVTHQSTTRNQTFSLGSTLQPSIPETLRSSNPLSSDPHGSSRPVTTASLRMPETLEHEMPPRRELPFKRPASHHSISSRPSTAAKSDSHSTNAGGSSEPTTIPSALSPSRKPTAVRPATAAALKRPIVQTFADPVKKVLAVEARPQSHASLSSKVSSWETISKPAKEAHSDASTRRPSKLEEMLRITKPLADHSLNSNKVARLDSLADAPYELETPPGSSSSPHKTSTTVVPSSPNSVAGRLTSSPGRPTGAQVVPTSPLRSTAAANGPVANATTALARPSEGGDTASLADYVAQSREDRQTILDEFMVSKLEDPNFAVLCEDLDSCWRRIALGL